MTTPQHAPGGGVPDAQDAHHPTNGHPAGETVEGLARARGLPAQWLREVVGLADLPGGGVSVPYWDESGGELLYRRTRGAPGGPRFRQPAGVSLLPYGLWRLADMDGSEALYITEGESDAWTLWHVGIHALGVPGSNCCGCLQASHTAGIRKLYLCADNDEAGRQMTAQLVKRLGEIGFTGRAYLVGLPPGVKDVSELYLGDPPGFLSRFRLQVEKATVLAIPRPQPRGQAPPPPVLTPLLVQMSSVAPEAPRWLWHGWIPEGALVILDGDPGLGKALWTFTALPTPTGWTLMGDVQVGDYLLDEQGRPCRVTAATEVMVDRPCYRLRFSDGTEVVADAEHLWLTTDRAARHREAKRRYKRTLNTTLRRNRAPRPDRLADGGQVRTTAEIAATLTCSDGRANHAIPATLGLALPDASLPIPPYTLGAWLGDGHSADGRITCFDPEIIAEIHADGYETSASSVPGLHTILGLKPQLREADVLGSKKIPRPYLRGSDRQRMRLLTGLLDTDGYCQPCGTVEFTSTNSLLADDVVELARSLGWVATKAEGRATLRGVDVGPKFRVFFTPDRPVFTIPRKVARQGQVRRASHGWRYITSCEPCESEPVRCVQVDSPSRLYLASSSMIPTHNSTLTLDLTARITTGRVMPPGDGVDLRGPAGVLLLGAEDSLKHTVRPRLDAAGADCSRVYSLEAIVGADGDEQPPMLPRDLGLVAGRIVELGIKLIVIDPLMAFLGAGVDTHKDHDIRRCLRPMAHLAERLGVTVLLLRHLNKLAGGPALYRGTSSIGITGAARAALIVGRDPEADCHVLAMNKCNLAPRPTSLAYHLESAGISSRAVWDGECEWGPNDILGHAGLSKAPGQTAKKGRPDDAFREACTFLADCLCSGPVAVLDIQTAAEADGIRWRTVERAKKHLNVQSSQQQKAWFWELPQSAISPIVCGEDTPPDDPFG